MHARRSRLVVVLAFLLVSCSGGGGKQSTPTTTGPTNTTISSNGEAAPPAPSLLGPTGVDRDLGPCPTQGLHIDLAKANAGALGLGLNRRLVPLTATVVRVCHYLVGGYEAPTRLVGWRLLGSAEAKALEATTNSLPVWPGAPSCPINPGGRTFETFLLSFASASQKVEVVGDTNCDRLVSNGTFSAALTKEWLNELQLYTPVPGKYTTGPTGPASPSPQVGYQTTATT